MSINQPSYLPWLGYFHRIAVSDAHVVLDHVQFEKNSFINRNKIRTANGWCWLSVPIKTKNRFCDLAINRLEIAEGSSWSRKHWESLRLNYGRSRYFDEHAFFFEKTLLSQRTSFLPLATEILVYLLKQFQISTPIFFSSQLGVGGVKDALVLAICQRMGATQYLSGPLGRDYLDEKFFVEADITVQYHDYIHPQYLQVFKGFEPYMAAIDILFNYGPDSQSIVLGI